MQSKNLKIYSKIANKLLGSLVVHRFNDAFYELLKKLMLHSLTKIEESGEQPVASRLRDSYYPSHIYKDVVQELENMKDLPVSVEQKQLKFL